MASDRPNQTLADYVAVAISPVLIMGLVGSLVFFLLEVLYPAEGDYKGRLQWILFFFVFGAVLVGRISLTAGVAGRAGLYGLVLAGLTWLGMQIYVEYPTRGGAAAFSGLVNLFLVGVVWWCAHRLTKDCTDIDEETESNGEGLLQATGMEKPTGDAGPPKPEDKADIEDNQEGHSSGWLIGWWERYQRFREARKKRRVLGAWVVYFSLAALPLFGLGEALIPAEEEGRRQYAFWLMACYIGSGLGLLLTTCFLGLRRTLRQRRLRMPAAMTAAWLTAGGGLIVALLVIGALLPRPRPEYSLFSGPSAGGDRRSASKYAVQGGGAGKDQGREIGDAPKDKAAPSDKDATANDKDKGESAEDKDKGSAAGDKDKDGAGKGSEKGKGDDAKDQVKDKSSNPDQPPPKDAPQNPSKPNAPPDSPATSHPGSSWDWAAVLSAAATILKWIVFALLILVVVFFLMREGLRFLAHFTDWARNLLNALQNLWANLFRGRQKTANGESGEGGAAKPRAPPLPFSSYVNPFRDGQGGGRPIKELVRYTFDALQAWARDHGLERLPDETPLEFAARLGGEFPALEADVRRFALLYARAVYDYAPLPAAAGEAVRRFWERLETAAEQPMSA